MTHSLLHALERALSLEPSAIHFADDTCVAFTTASGYLDVSWLTDRGRQDAGRLPREGTHLGPNGPAPHARTSEMVTFSIPIALVGDARLLPYDGEVSLVLQHVCPEARHTWLGPWGESTAHGLYMALREALYLPRKLGARLAPTHAELSKDPRRFHGELIVVEGKWHPPRWGGPPSLVGGGTVIFPPGITKPDRATHVRLEGVWLVGSRPGFSSRGSPYAISARLVEELPWASRLAPGHRRVHGLPLPERLIGLLDSGTWSPRLLSEGSKTALLSETGWERTLDTFLPEDEIEEQICRIHAMAGPDKQRLGFAKGTPDSLDEDRALILATNADGRMIALDYRRDPPVVMHTQQARDGFRWRMIAADFDEFAARFLRDVHRA